MKKKTLKGDRKVMTERWEENQENAVSRNPAKENT